MGSAIRPEDLARSELLSCLPPDALEDLARASSVHEFSAGETIFDRGDAGTSLHIVLVGAVNIVQPDEPGSPVVAVMPAGTTFGELAVLDPAPRSASAIAGPACRTVEVQGADLERALEAHPHAAIRMLGTMTRSLTNAKEQQTLFSQFLDEKVRERTLEVRETQLEVIRRLGQAAEYRDEDTGAHIFRMSNYAAALARAVGFAAERAEVLLYAAPMHDVGKIGVPDRILLKPAKLDEEEWEVMKAHTIMGANMLTGSRSEIIQLAQRIALTHHERWDGRGYPHGIRGEEIPIEARICCIADVFDALTSERPYKKAWTFEDALTEIDSLRGAAFDPALVDHFAALTPELERIRDDSLSVETVARTTIAPTPATPATPAEG